MLSYVLTGVIPFLPGGYRDQEEAYLQEVHIQRCGPGPASGHVLVSDTTDTVTGDVIQSTRVPVLLLHILT